MTVADDVIRILAHQAVLDPSEVQPHMRLQDLGIDSLGMAEAIFSIEEHFDVTVPFSASSAQASGIDLSTVASVIDGVERLMAEKTG